MLGKLCAAPRVRGAPGSWGLNVTSLTAHNCPSRVQTTLGLGEDTVKPTLSLVLGEGCLFWKERDCK